MPVTKRHDIVGGALALASLTAEAHHSIAAVYDGKKLVTLDGKLVQFVFRNPHSFVHMEAPDGQGDVKRWAVEWAGTAQLGAQGVKRESLKVGDEITVTARPSRVPGEYRALMLSLKRPLDGFAWGTRAGEAVD